VLYRRLVLTLAVVVVLLAALQALALAAGLALSRQPAAQGPTPENFASLHAGMTRQWVEDVLGPPARHVVRDTGECILWWSPTGGGTIVIQFEDASPRAHPWDGSLADGCGHCQSLAPKPPPWYAPLRQWLRLAARPWHWDA
jgi:hypothetical protein